MITGSALRGKDKERSDAVLQWSPVMITGSAAKMAYAEELAQSLQWSPVMITGSAGGGGEGVAELVVAAMEPGDDHRVGAELARRLDDTDMLQWSPVMITGSAPDFTYTARWDMELQWSPVMITGSAMVGHPCRRRARHAAMEPGDDHRVGMHHMREISQYNALLQWSPVMITGSARLSRRCRPPASRRCNGAR